MPADRDDAAFEREHRHACRYRADCSAGAGRPACARPKTPSSSRRGRSPTRRPSSPRWRAPTSFRRAPASAGPWCSSRCSAAIRSTQGQVLATVGDEKLALQMKALDAQILGLEAALTKAKADLVPAQEPIHRGAAPNAVLDDAQSALDVATNLLKSRTAERAVIEQQIDEGQVLAPAAGRVLKVPVTEGSVSWPAKRRHDRGQRISCCASVPERHARFIKAGDPVRSAARARPKRRRGSAPSGRSIPSWRMAASSPTRGRRPRRLFRRRARPRLDLGRQAHGILVPRASSSSASASTTCASRSDGRRACDVVVQPGRGTEAPDSRTAIEILAGHGRRQAGAAMNLGLSGRLTRASSARR